MSEAEQRAQEARRLLAEIEPYLSALEHEAFEAATRTSWWNPMGLRRVKRLLERVSVIRDLRTRIEVAIATGKPRRNV
jgi:hypothetical protein